MISETKIQLYLYISRQYLFVILEKMAKTITSSYFYKYFLKEKDGKGDE